MRVFSAFCFPEEPVSLFLGCSSISSIFKMFDVYRKPHIIIHGVHVIMYICGCILPNEA